jgi:hypothetical protein
MASLCPNAWGVNTRRAGLVLDLFNDSSLRGFGPHAISSAADAGVSRRCTHGEGTKSLMRWAAKRHTLPGPERRSPPATPGVSRRPRPLREGSPASGCLHRGKPVARRRSNATAPSTPLIVGVATWTWTLRSSTWITTTPSAPFALGSATPATRRRHQGRRGATAISGRSSQGQKTPCSES